MATIQGVYVALFGRPADPAGLAYFNGVTNNGQDLAAIGNLAGQPEYTSRFENKNNAEIVNSIYRSLFNRDAETAGLNFFVDKLNKGELSINNIAIAILDGAQGEDRKIVDFKLDAAARFTAALDTPTEVAAYTGASLNSAIDFLALVTTAQSDEDIKAAVDAISAGATIELTTGADIANSAAATGFVTTVFNDTIDATTVAASWTTGDKIDAGSGIDTLNAVVAAGITVDGVNTKLDNVEVLNLGASAAATIDLEKATGVTDIWAKASAAALTVTNVAKTVSLGVDGTNAAVVFGLKDVSGSADEATVKLKAATVTGLTLDGVEKLTLAVDGAANVAGLAGASLKDVVVSGTGGGEFAFAASSATVKSFDASAVNGAGVTVDLTNAASGVTVTGSKFADTITLGAGKDVVVFNASNVSTLTQKDVISGFTSGTDKIDLKAFGFASSATAAITTFGVAPVEGSSFLGNAVGAEGTTLFVDTNKDGVFNAATDLQVDLTGVAITDFIFA